MAAKSKTLYRSQRDYIFAGVAGGLGEYFNTTPWLFRILFFINPGSLIYIIMWLVVPLNPTQKRVNRPHGNARIWVILLLLLFPILIFSFIFLNFLSAMTIGILGSVMSH